MTDPILHHPRQDNDYGFSMVEALVALSVFALAGVGLVSLQTHSISTLRKVEAHALAGMVAQNVLVAAVADSAPPDLGMRSDDTTMGGRIWTWRREVEPTAEPDVVRITVAVSEAGKTDTAVRIHGFRVVQSDQ